MCCDQGSVGSASSRVGVSRRRPWLRQQQEAFDEIAADFIAKHQQQIEQERRELDGWLAQRVDEIVGRSEQALPLFQELTEKSQTPLERLTEFVAQAGKTSRERNEAESILRLYRSREALFATHARLNSEPHYYRSVSY